MKKVLFVLLLFISLICKGQDSLNVDEQYHQEAPIPVEVMAGNNWLMFQNLITKDFGRNDKFNYFNLINYEVDYDENVPASYIVQSIFSYKILERLSVGAGANLKAFGGFKPLVAAQFTSFNQNIGLVLQPSVEIDKDGVAELFGLFEWHPYIKKSWMPYFSIQGASSLGLKNGEHDFSYLNTRLGVQFSQFRVGPALNARFIGSNAHSEWNWGAFVSILIN